MAPISVIPQLDDNTIEISVTPNRAICLGIIGVARDVAVLNQLPLVQPEIVPVGATMTTRCRLQSKRRKPARVILAVW
ncbi:hypothetical protein ACNKHV_09295 [Shigella flexneri]